MIAISIIKGVFNIKTNKALYDIEVEFENLMDDAPDSLSPANFNKLKDSVMMLIEDYEG